MKKILAFGPLFVITAALLWSFDGVLRVSLYSLPPSIIVFWEHILGAIILTPFILTKFKQFKSLTKKEWVAIGLVGLFSGALGTIFYTAALAKVNYIQFSVVVLLQQLQPIWALTTAAIILKEKLDRKFIVWAMIAIASSYIVTFKDLRINFETGQGTIIAATLALLAGVVWAVSTTLSKIVLNKVSFLIATYLRFLFAPFFAFLIILGLGQNSQVTALSPSQWQTIALITFSTGMVALLFYYYGLKKTTVKITTICELVWPASAIFIDYFYFHKTLSPTQIIGVIILIYSIYRVTQFQHDHEVDSGDSRSR